MARAIIGQCLIVALGDGETEVSHVGIEAVDLNKAMIIGKNLQRSPLRWLNTVLQAVSWNSLDGACFLKLDREQTWWRKKQGYHCRNL